jgi:hypothetical protein
LSQNITENSLHADEIESVFKPLPKDVNLDLVFSKRFPRKVNNDHTIQFQGQTIQLPPSPHKLSLARRMVEVRLRPDNKIFILYQGKLIHTDYLSPQNKKTRLERKFEEFLNRRELRERSKKLTSLLSKKLTS